MNRRMARSSLISLLALGWIASAAWAGPGCGGKGMAGPGPMGPGAMGPGACGAKSMCGGPEGCGGMAERLGMLLGLTDEQKAQIEKICPAEQPKIIALQKEMKRVRNDLRGEMMKDEPDLSKAKKYAERIGEIRASIQIAHLECQIAVRKILTPEQRDRLILMGPGCCGGPEGRGPRGHGRGGCGIGPQGGMQRHECPGGMGGAEKTEM